MVLLAVINEERGCDYTICCGVKVITKQASQTIDEFIKYVMETYGKDEYDNPREIEFYDATEKKLISKEKTTIWELK